MLKLIINKLKKILSIYKFYNNRKLVESFSVYYPHSQNHYVYPKNTFTSANNSIIILSDIVEERCKINIISADDFLTEFRNGEDKKLKDLFDKYGSDKSSFHNYDLVYSSILSILRTEVKSIKLFEIGLGTNNVNVPSNMGVHGKPGASLRAFRDYLPNSTILGADIDKNVLFEEEGIVTSYLDQTNFQTYLDIYRKFDIASYNLIIDDGLHSPEANLNTIKFALKHLSPKGWVVIEDIPERSLPVWKAMNFVMEKDYRTWLVDCQGYYLFIMNKKE